MATILIGHSSIDENGNATGGAAGDQTGKEVCTRSWYSKPWDYMAIHPDATVREKHASCCEAACANDKIGYDQNQRNTLHTQAKAVNFDYSKITTKCECDCSSLQNSLAVASGSGATYASNGWTTSTMKTQLQNLGYKIITDSTYLTSADYCVRGAIYVKSGSHTVTGLTNGSKYTETLAKAGLSTSTSTSSSSSSSTSSSNSLNKTTQWTGTVTATSLNVRTGAGTSYDKCSFSPLKKGLSVGVCDTVKASDGTSWYYINYNGKYGFVSASYVSKNTSTSSSSSSSSTSVATSTKTATEKASSYDKSLTGTYKTTANLNIRNGAGTNKSILVTIPKGTSVTNYGYYTIVSGVKWMYVQFTYNKVQYTGFCSKQYLTK